MIDEIIVKEESIIEELTPIVLPGIEEVSPIYVSVIEEVSPIEVSVDVKIPKTEEILPAIKEPDTVPE